MWQGHGMSGRIFRGGERVTFRKRDSAGFLINLQARIMARELSRGLKPLGLSIGYFPALLELWAQDGLTQKELVARLHIEQATMANTLARMERDGLIRRETNPGDGRSQRIRLTAAGRAARAPAVAAAEAVNAEMLAPLSEAERRVFLSMTQRVVEAALARER